jgi:hypothetical protein
MHINKSVFLVILISFCSIIILAQEYNPIYQNRTFNHYDRFVYQSNANFHTSIKPFINSQLEPIVIIDSIYRKLVNSKLGEIVFNRNLIQFKEDDFAFTIDPLLNFEIGKDPDFDDISWINTRGVLVNAQLGKKVTISSSFYENQASFFDYRHDRIMELQNKIIPGQGPAKEFGDSLANNYDYSFAMGNISYSPNEHFNFQLGHGKNFWGDGYRSLLLSDNAFNYPYFKITTDFWNIKYVNLWAQFQDIRVREAYEKPFAKKWGSFHYLSWNVTDWLNVGFFEAIIWQNADSTGHRGFDFNYANPVIFLRPVEFSVGSPDNALMGITGKVTFLKSHILYGQAIIDEMQINELRNGNGWWGNKYGFQLGYKTFDLFNIQHFDIQTEFNYVRPYTYSHVTPVQNYAHYNQPLAHPLGSNFWESVSFIKYNKKRFFAELRYSYAIHGSDTAGLNYGNDLYLNYTTRVSEYDNYLGQADEVTLQYLNLNLAYLVNPSTNLNVYISVTKRLEKSSFIDLNQNLITFGIRTSIQNFYYDF